MKNSYVALNPAFRDYEERSGKIDKCFHYTKGWREECYEVKSDFTKSSENGSISNMFVWY